MPSQPDTIFALSSAPGRSGVSVIRVSGPRAQHVLASMVQGTVVPRMVRRARLVDPGDGVVLDDALVTWFAAPKSFTGEDVVELHVHGGRAVVAGVLGALGRLPKYRLAEPGEFTRRAFEAGKIDLTEAEGLADLINAETEAQRRLALRQLSGALHSEAERWRGALLRAQALVEAAIDFSDEADVSLGAVAQARAIVVDMVQRLRRVLDDQHRGEILRDGFKVVIAGPPNVGKSSLLNALARRDAAIVSAEAGTTRDVLELHLNLGGLAIVVADTAGLRDAVGAIEQEGIRRAKDRARAADLVVWVVDASDPNPIVASDIAGDERGTDRTLVVINKADCVSGEQAAGLGRQLGGRRWVVLSALTGDGVRHLEDAVAAEAAARTEGGEAALLTTVRHRQHVAAAALATERFLSGAADDLELRAEDLRSAAQAIGRLVGRVDVEEILGEIFGRFCIGK